MTWTTPTPTPASTTTPSPDESAAGGNGSGSLAVAEIHADSDGDDHENTNGEYIVFENDGDAALDLTGWTVADEADHTYRFPDGFTLTTGKHVTPYSERETVTATELYWGSGNAIWNNGGDTVIVRATPAR